jgi:hypothetical protein
MSAPIVVAATRTIVGTQADFVALDPNHLPIGTRFIFRDIQGAELVVFPDPSNPLLHTWSAPRSPTFSPTPQRVFLSPTGNDFNDGLTPATAIASMPEAVFRVSSGWAQDPIAGARIIAAPGFYPDPAGGQGWSAGILPACPFPLVVEGGFNVVSSGTVTSVTNGPPPFTGFAFAFTGPTIPPGQEKFFQGAIVRFTNASGQYIRRIGYSTAGTPNFPFLTTFTCYLQTAVPNLSVGDTWEILTPNAIFEIVNFCNFNGMSQNSIGTGAFNLLFWGCEFLIRANSTLALQRGISLACGGSNFQFDDATAQYVISNGSQQVCTSDLSPIIPDLVQPGHGFPGCGFQGVGAQDAPQFILSAFTKMVGDYTFKQMGSISVADDAQLVLSEPSICDIGTIAVGPRAEFTLETLGNRPFLPGIIDNGGSPIVPARGGAIEMGFGNGQIIGLLAILNDPTDLAAILIDSNGTMDLQPTVAGPQLTGNGGQTGVYVFPGGKFTGFATIGGAPFFGINTLTGSVSELIVGQNPPNLQTWAIYLPGGGQVSAVAPMGGGFVSSDGAIIAVTGV